MRTMWNEPTENERRIRERIEINKFGFGAAVLVVEQWVGDHWERQADAWREGRHWRIEGESCHLVAALSEDEVAELLLLDGGRGLPHAPDCRCDDCMEGDDL